MGSLSGGDFLVSHHDADLARQNETMAVGKPSGGVRSWDYGDVATSVYPLSVHG